MIPSPTLKAQSKREKEIQAFLEREYWTIGAKLENVERQGLTAALVEAEGKKLGKFDIPDQEVAFRLFAQLGGRAFPQPQPAAIAPPRSESIPRR